MSTASVPGGASQPMLVLDGLGRRFGERWAVRDISLEIGRGEVVGLLGPNGAGKTTTIRMLAALIAPSEGRAIVDGLDVREAPDDVRARIGILTESPGLYDKLSAERNLDYFGQLHRLPGHLRAERIERLLRLLDLSERRRDPAGTFSKGMRQKLAIARAMLHDPTILFLDEPTAALDPESAFVVRDAIARLRGAGRTIVLCTHNLDEAERLCDRIAFLRGSLLRVDSPARIRAASGAGLVEVRLAAEGPRNGRLEPLRSIAGGMPGVRAARMADGDAQPILKLELDDPERQTPAVVTALVRAGAAVVEVKQEAATLEDAYFEVMGVRPGSAEDVA